MLRAYISPDGRWLLLMWPGPDYAAWDLDGPGEVHWGAEAGWIVSWFNDSHHLLGISGNRAYIYSVDHSTRKQIVPLPHSNLLLRKTIQSQEVRCLSKSLFLINTDLKKFETLHGGWKTRPSEIMVRTLLIATRCPAATGAYGYALNRRVGNADLRQIEAPVDTVLIFEADMFRSPGIILTLVHQSASHLLRAG